MALKKQSVCETIISNQTSVLLIESQKCIGNMLSNQLHERNMIATIKSRNLKGKCQIKPYDIYVINCSDYNEIERQAIVEKIIRTAPDSEIYLVDNCDAEQSKLNAKYRKIASDLKNNQAITDVINCDYDGINQIIDAIQSVEYTKFKIHELWHKLEKS